VPVQNYDSPEQLLTVARRAAAQYPYLPHAAQPLHGGRINQNYHVWGDTGEKVLRLYAPGRRAHQVEFEIALLKYLHALGAPVPTPFADKEGQFVQKSKITEDDSQVFVWLDFIQGSVLSHQALHALDPSVVHSFLTPLLSALHAFPPPFRPVHETRTFSRSIPSLIFALGQSPPAFPVQDVAQLYQNLVVFEKSLKLPPGVVHGDLHGGNILLNHESNSLSLIDFDDAHVSHRALDWVLAALEFSWTSQAGVPDAPCNLRLDENRYQVLLSCLSQALATKEEIAAFDSLRQIIALKRAAHAHDLGDQSVRDRYLALLAPPL